MNKGHTTYRHTIGLESFWFINENMKKTEEEQAEFHEWLEEILTNCKTEFERPDIRLLPKTPSAKRSRKKTRKNDSDVFELPSKHKCSQENEEIDADVEEEQTNRRGRPRRAASRTVSNSSNNTKAKKKKISGDGPQMALIKVVKNENSNMLSVCPPENDRLNVVTLPTEKSPLHKNTGLCVKKAGPGHVKNKVNVFEDLIEESSPSTLRNNSCNTTPRNHSSNTTPVTLKRLHHTSIPDSCETTKPVPETPEQDDQSSATPDTIKRPEGHVETCTPMHVSHQTSNIVETLNNSLTPSAQNESGGQQNRLSRSSSSRRSRRSSRASLRKSLKMLTSQTKLEMTKMRNHLQFSALASNVSVNQDSPSTDACLPSTPTTEGKAIHSKLKLKKKGLQVEPQAVSSQQTSEELKESVTKGDVRADSQSDKVLNTPVTVDESFDELVVKNLQVVYVEDSDIDLISDIEDEKINVQESDVCEKNDNSGDAKRDRSTFTAQEICMEVNNESLMKADNLQTQDDTQDLSVKPVCASTPTKQRKNTATSSVSSNDDPKLDRDSGLGKDADIVRTTRSKIRKPKTVTSSVDDSDADDERMGDEEAVPVRQSTRTKQRKQTASTASTSDLGESSLEPPVRTSSRTKQRKNTAASSVSSVDDVMEVDGEGQVRQSTRSKARKPRAAPASVSSDETDDPFLMPEAPPMRSTRTKTRKRQLDEDNSADESISKKSCTENSISQIEDSFEQLERLCNSSVDFSNSKETFTQKSSESSDSGSAEKPGSAAKPTSFVNNLSKALPSSALSTGIVRSFLQNKNSPAKLSLKEQQEQRKKELNTKQKKDEQRLQQRELLMKTRIEEQRKKREERMKKAANQRQLLQKHDIDLKNKLQKQREEKLQQTESLREEKLKEEKEKQRLRLKKMQEAEERRKHDEEERLRKLKEQEEEEKRLKELQAKKKEQEQKERQRLILEERRRLEERAAQLERERQAEQERQKQALEEERQKEAERQRLKEQREKAALLAQAEKERLELEKKRERELLLKKNLEKQKEMARKQQEKWDKQKEEQKRQAAELQNLIAKHNASVTAPAQVKKVPLPKPTFNTTHNMSQSTNSDSYEMTPVRKYSRNYDNYDITDMKSDDSTDDDEKPRRKIPEWASGPTLKALLISQHYNPPDLPKLFGPIDPPDLNQLFYKKKARFNKRTSSAHWDSPIMKPGTTFLN